MSKTELLSSGQNPAGLAEGGVAQLGEAHEANAGLPYLGSGAEAEADGRRPFIPPEHRIPPEELPENLRAKFPEGVPEMRGGGGEIPRIPPEQLPPGLREKYPEGLPIIGGGSGGAEDMLLTFAQLLTQAGPFEITELMAERSGVVNNLDHRGFWTAEASRYIKSWPIEIRMVPDPTNPGLQKMEVVRKASPLTSVAQTVTTSAREAFLNSVDPRNPGRQRPVPYLPLIINNPDGSRTPIRPLVYEDIEPETIARFQAETGILPADIRSREYQWLRDVTRKQQAIALLMLSQNPSLARILSQDDQISMMQSAERLAAGTHDEIAVVAMQKLITQVQRAITADTTDPLKNLYQELTFVPAFEALKTDKIGLEFNLTAPDGRKQAVSGWVAMGDYLDELLYSQRNVELVQQLDTHEVLKEEMNLMMRVLGRKLIVYDQDPGKRYCLQDYLERGWQITRTNIPDAEIMMPLNAETAGNPMDEMIVSSQYGMFKAAKEFARFLLLDMEVLPVFSAKAGKKWRELLGYNYAVHLYRLGMYGLAELFKVNKYRSLVSEKIIPKAIDTINFEPDRGEWIDQLRGFVNTRGGRWMESWGRYRTAGELQKAVVRRIFTRPTILESESPAIEELVTLLVAKNPDLSMDQKVEAFAKQIVKLTGDVLPESEEQRYRDEVRTLLNQYEARTLTGKPAGVSDIDEVKHRIIDALYRYRSQRPGGFKPKEEVLASLENLTRAEKAVLDWGVNSGGGIDVEGLAIEMGFFREEVRNSIKVKVCTLANTKGFAGIEAIAQGWGVARMPFIGALREIDAVSVAGYLEDTVNQRKDTTKFIEQIASGEIAQVARLPGAGGAAEKDITVGYNISQVFSGYSAETLRYITFAEWQQRGEELVKVLLRAITPLGDGELIPVFWRVGLKGAEIPTIQEAYIPMEALYSGQNEHLRQWLLGVGIRGADKGGKAKEIFMGDNPPRLQVKFGDLNLLKDMREANKLNSQPKTLVGMERSGYETVGWKMIIALLERVLKGKNIVTEYGIRRIEEYAGKHFRFGHGISSETAEWHAMNVAGGVGRVAGAVGNVIGKLAGGG